VENEVMEVLGSFVVMKEERKDVYDIHASNASAAAKSVNAYNSNDDHPMTRCRVKPGIL
jgi:hypothetical protein